MTNEYEEDLKNFEWYSGSFEDEDYVTILCIEKEVESDGTEI